MQDRAPSPQGPHVDCAIPRRDFVLGVLGAAGLAALGGCAGDVPEPVTPTVYPPALTGLRGTTDAVLAAGHQVRDDRFKASTFTMPARDETFDLIVVGAGISGLTAAHLYRAAHPNARILILENNDDFGGHARRNEFIVDGRTLVSYGGVEYFDHPSLYPDSAKKVLASLDIVPVDVAKGFDTELYAKLGLTEGLYLSGPEYGGGKLIPDFGGAPWPALSRTLPIPAAAQRDVVRLFTAKRDYLPALKGDALLTYLGTTSYRTYLQKNVRLNPAVIHLLQSRTSSLFGLGIDAVSALDCAALDFPGFAGLTLPPLTSSPLLGRTPRMHQSTADEHSERYHYPDGGATLARLLVRSLIPEAAPAAVGSTLQSTPANYAALDRRRGPVRIRLNSTVVRVVHQGGPSSSTVNVSYAQNGTLRTAQAGHVVLACWHGVIPHICPELSAPQREALAYGVKVPLLYTNVAIRNWRSFVKAGVSNVECPNQFYASMKLDFPVSGDGYQFARTPDEPIVVNLVSTPSQPGMSMRDQYRLGRTKLLATTFATIEQETRALMTGVLGPSGFDADRDIAGITANRWGHGYAYEYNSLFDPVWAPGESPAEKARQPFGHVAIANSDGAAFAYMSGAMEMAAAAVDYLLTVR